jgi:lipoprotein-anchoring transpeptidase ErfK/SrfK
MLSAQLRSKSAPRALPDIDTETRALEAAIVRIEAEVASITASKLSRPVHDEKNAHAGPVNRKAILIKGSWLIISLCCICVAVIFAFAPAVYEAVKKTPPASGTPIGRTGDGVRISRSTDTDDELAPGVDGGATDPGLPYYFRRQPIYYRTTHAVGSVLIDRSQRYLYLIEPKIVALRYGIGVGIECSETAGLRRVTNKVEWPDWTPSAELLKRHSYPARVAGGPGNPLGARALALDGNLAGIHGTNAPKTIGHAVNVGCFRMTNEDIIDFYPRVPIGAAIIVSN